jgi:hypothetical protein
MFIPPILKLAMDKNRFCQSSRGLNKWAKDTNVASEGAVDGLGDGQSKAANRVVARWKACHVTVPNLDGFPHLLPWSLALE